MALTLAEEGCGDRWRRRRGEQLRRQIERKRARACAEPRWFQLQTPEFRDSHRCGEEGGFAHSAASQRLLRLEGSPASTSLRRQCFPPATPERRLSQPCRHNRKAATIQRRRLQTSDRWVKRAARQASD